MLVLSLSLRTELWAYFGGQTDPKLLRLRLVFEKIALPPSDDAEGDEGGSDAAGQNHGYQHQQIL